MSEREETDDMATCSLQWTLDKLGLENIPAYPMCLECYHCKTVYERDE